MRMLNRMLCFVMLLMVVLSPAALAGAMVEVNGIKAYLPAYAADQPSSSQQDEIIAAAMAYQTNGSSYKADKFLVTLIPAKTKIYGMVPYQSTFYTDKATVDKAKDWSELYQLLQIKLPTEYEPRKGFATYETAVDMWIAAGFCYNNRQFGVGGGYQYVVPVFIKQQEIYSNEKTFAQRWINKTKPQFEKKAA